MKYCEGLAYGNINSCAKGVGSFFAKYARVDLVKVMENCKTFESQEGQQGCIFGIVRQKMLSGSLVNEIEVECERTPDGKWAGICKVAVSQYGT